MVSRCCLTDVYIEGYEEYYYACLHCGNACELRPALTKGEVHVLTMGSNHTRTKFTLDRQVESAWGLDCAVG